MKVSREQMAENRQRILSEAGRLFRVKGFDAVSVAEVMGAAGLTHGGFYGHFASKDELIAETLGTLLAGMGAAAGDHEDYVARYLSLAHRDNPAGGCPLAGLAAATRHQTPAARATLTAGLRAEVERLASAGSGDADARRQAAIGTMATLVGAVILARATDEPELAAEILEQSRAWIGERDGRPAGRRSESVRDGGACGS